MKSPGEKKPPEFKWILIGLINCSIQMESNRLCSNSLEKEMEVSPGPQVELKLTMSWKEKKKKNHIRAHEQEHRLWLWDSFFFPSAAVLFHLELSAKEAAPDTKLRAVRACPEVQSPQRTGRPLSVYW